MQLANRRILLGVSGGIAAYKACELVRRLRDLGALVRVVMTESATHFVSATANEAVVTSVPDLAEQRAPLDAAQLARVLVPGT